MTFACRIEANIIGRCNASCWGCNKGFDINRHLVDDMTVEQMHKAVNQLLEQKIIVKRFTFCGGEPILHSNLQEMIDEVARLKTLKWGRVLTNGMPQTKHLRDKIKLPKRFSWVENPLDEPDNPLSGKNDPRKRPNQRYHTPFWISPADVGMEANFENCTVRGWCGIGLDAAGWSICGKAVMFGKLLGVDPSMREGDIATHVMTPVPEICRHCQYGTRGGGAGTGSNKHKGPIHDIERMYRRGELKDCEDGISPTFRKAFEQFEKKPLVQLQVL